MAFNSCVSSLLVVKVHNVNFALDLMDDAGLPKAKARAEGKNASIHCFYSIRHLGRVQLRLDQRACQCFSTDRCAQSSCCCN